MDSIVMEDFFIFRRLPTGISCLALKCMYRIDSDVLSHFPFLPVVFAL